MNLWPCGDCGGETLIPFKLCQGCVQKRLDHAEELKIAKLQWIEQFAESYVDRELDHRHEDYSCDICEKNYEYALEELGPKEWETEASHLWVQENL